ncbi:MAG TPA: hypothetical protein VF531_05520 [Bacillota bacterium]
MLLERHSPQTLQLLIKKKWLADSIIGLGSGYLTHLTYQTKDVAPEVLEDYHEMRSGEVYGEIIWVGDEVNRRVAEAEVSSINDFGSFIRFDLRLLEVVPFIRDGAVHVRNDYLCYYG